jgi:hypothetical protein
MDINVIVVVVIGIRVVITVIRIVISRIVSSRCSVTII